LPTLLVAAEHGGDSALRAHRVKGVRMIDWPTIEADLKKIDREIAARIVGIARRRTAPAALVAAGAG
jgi:putative N-acetylmannosamine-6-phosphate epimerase